MPEVWFYHMTGTSLDQTLPSLLEKTLHRSWRAVVRVGSAAGLGKLDEKLWTYKTGSFLTHGTYDAPLQPVYLTTEVGVVSNAEALFLVDRAAYDTSESAAYTRVCILFDGQDVQAVDAARAQWKQVTSDGLAAVYWSNESGRWSEKMRRAAPTD